jgi:hypothetical protein
MMPHFVGGDTYSMTVICSNCGFRGTAYWQKGIKAATTTCARCGCTTAVPEKRL